MQRLRIRISRREELKYISHLDIMRLWERALHRTSIPLAYSKGYNPRPRISLAAPLPVGVTSEAELMDIWLNKWVSPHLFIDAVSQQLPAGIIIKHTVSAITGPLC
jgi:radical SAM-linked protein